MELTPKERIAFEVFNASFFQPSADARFLLRVMAIEALLEPRPRDAAARQHVESLIAATQAEPSLTPGRAAFYPGFAALAEAGVHKSRRKASC